MDPRSGAWRWAGLGGGRAVGAIPTDFDRLYPSLAGLRSARDPAVLAMERGLACARRLRHEVLAPRALEEEAAAGRDPAHVPEVVLEAAARRGWFTLAVPRVLGGQGLPFAAMILALEELSAGCLGLANVLGVHGLALATAAATGDAGKVARLCRAIAASERAGRPHLLATSITEPLAGTDMEAPSWMRRGRVESEARQAPGGYALSGRKVFISNGSLATEHVVLMPLDRRRPVETMAVFLVPAGAPGLSVGAVERKMGQKACPAAELRFEDCFVSEEARFEGGSFVPRGLALALGATRAAVGAFAAGLARGVLERVTALASTRSFRGRPLVEAPWVRARLADLEARAAAARATMLSSVLGNEVFGLLAFTKAGVVDALLGGLPEPVRGRIDVAALPPAVQPLRPAAVEGMPADGVALASGLGALAKVACSDLAVECAELGLDVLGGAGVRADLGLEKLYRDARLLQIYEGTNELNRQEIFDALAGRHAGAAP